MNFWLSNDQIIALSDKPVRQKIPQSPTFQNDSILESIEDEDALDSARKKRIFKRCATRSRKPNETASKIYSPRAGESRHITPRHQTRLSFLRENELGLQVDNMRNNLLERIRVAQEQSIDSQERD